MTLAQVAKGCVLSWNGNPVASIISLAGPNKSANVINVTAHDSPDGFEQFISGLRNGGEFSGSGNFIPGDTNGQIAMNSDFDAGTPRVALLTFPAAMGATITAAVAIITAFSLTANASEQAQFSFTIKISGKPTLAVTASNNCTALAASGGVLYPVFAAATYDYVVAVAGATTAVTATFAAGTAYLYAGDVLQQVLASTVASTAVALGAIGSQVVLKVTVQEANKTMKTYLLRCGRVS